MKKTVLKFKTIFLSDVHLGMKDCQIEAVNHFMQHTHCDKLVLNGDIIDGWALRRSGRWTKKHTKFVRLVLKKMEKKKVPVVYLRGNHDDILERFLPLNFGRLDVCQEYVHETPNGNYLVVHGDGFDAVCTGHKWLALLGDIGYGLMLKLNRAYNRFRRWRGKEYFSLSQLVKERVKSAVSFVGKYEEQLQALARKRNFAGIICGHIHTPANRMVGEVHYLNSGDWVESKTALVEHFDGSFEVLTYEEFCRRLEAKSQEAVEDGLTPLEDEDDADETLIPAAAFERYQSA
ncbi:MAG: UDP-2,3-diacylglucosamine diphosphatase [Verrucomicrobiota bacterium]